MTARFWLAVLLAPLLISAAVFLVNLVFVIGFGASFPALLQLILASMPILYVATVLGWLPTALFIHRFFTRKGVASILAAGLFWLAVGIVSIISSDVAFGEGHPAFLFLCVVAGLFAGLMHWLIVYRRPAAGAS